MKEKSYRVKEGLHVHDDGVTYKKGETLRDTRDLVAAFPQKFEEATGEGHETDPVARAEALRKQLDAAEAEIAANNAASAKKSAATPVKTAKQEAAQAKTEEAAPETEEETGLGDDVTKQFPSAKKAGVVVFHAEDGYYVADVDNTTKAMNKEPLKKAAVAEFISEIEKA